MSKQIIIAEQYRIAAVFSEEQIQELVVAKGSHQVSDIYYGIVENVLPGIDAAFVNIGDSERNGFIHVSDLGPLRLKKSASAITELLLPQQKVLVQVMKEPTGNKGPRLTGNISLPGRYLVLMPHGRGVNLSRRIRNENERNRLRALAILVKPAGMGLVVRTEAEAVPEEAITEDLEALQRQWEAILQEAGTTRAPALLNRDDDFVQRVLRDTFSGEVNRIVVDSNTGLKRVKQHLMSWSAGRLPQGVLIDQHKEPTPILDYFRVNAAIREALKPRVDLPSGGYIIIERTEALTVIDVNSGSFTKSATARETVLWTNYEAAAEIARQLRLRNIAGVIIVDFIDMDSRRDQLQLLEHFNRALKVDKARPQIAQLTELGLVELTRKRQGQNVYELFSQPCSTCEGTGHLVCLPGQKDAPDRDYGAFTAGTLDPGLDINETSSIGREIDPDRAARIRTRISTSSRDGRGLRNGDSPKTRDRAWPDRAEAGSEPDGEGFAPDFLHHPSYQDRNNSNRRRRRRRPLGAESAPLPGQERRSGPRESAPPYWDEVELEGTASDAGEGDEAVGLPLKKGRVDRRSPKPGSTNTPEPRGALASHKSAVVPREIVTVEMIAEEQEVYAWMGISPLVLANREVKNPRSVLVAVTLPGQTPDLSAIRDSSPRSGAGSLPRSSDSFSDELSDSESKDNGDDSELALVDGPMTDSEGDNPNFMVVEEPSGSEAPLSEGAPVLSVPEDTPNRRRRRRSSAETGESGGGDNE
jgi:ribonuclease E